MNKIITGDSFEKLDGLDAESVHAVVTDPPYGLAFMGRSWDDFEPKEYQEWCEKWATKAKRVLKPGGHLLAFSGNRTHHRLFTGVEDAGFEIRDTITWHYGSGFPKATDVSKTIDKRADAEREKVAEQHGNGIEPGHENYVNNEDSDWNDGGFDITEPATEQAEKWDGWKTGLKPATEYVVMARKPFDGATVDCVLEHGTGALNIGGTRIETDGNRPKIKHTGEPNEDSLINSDRPEPTATVDDKTEADGTTTEGRYPSNVVFDETEAERLDRQVGDVDGCSPHTITDSGKREVLDDGGLGATDDRVEGFNDSGGPSRYFYTSKASKSERTENGSIDNAHPTVKPQDLMEWLIKMVSREDQIILDPFCGSGTTCKAAKSLNRQFIGIEKQAQWADVARVRCNLTPDDPSVVRDDSAQEGLEAFGETD
jgi:site-specific DNA-methyltransferase (adenine-specific)